MKVGDLVFWHTDASVFSDAAADYSAPGIILKKVVVEKPWSRNYYSILWADGKTTNEHECYIHPIKNYKKSKNNT